MVGPGYGQIQHLPVGCSGRSWIKKEAMIAGIIACQGVKEAGMEEFIRLYKLN